MRNKFYKAVAIIAAMNMMSFTVFAAGTAETDIPADNSPVTESAAGNETPAEEQKQEEPAQEEKNEEPVQEEKNEEPAQEEKNVEPAQEEKNVEPAQEEKNVEPAQEEKNVEPAQEEQKQEEQKPEEQKPEEQKPEEQKPAEQKPEEQKPEEQKPEEQKPEEQKQEEQKTDEQKQEVQKQETQTGEGQNQNSDKKDDVNQTDSDKTEKTDATDSLNNIDTEQKSDNKNDSENVKEVEPGTEEVGLRRVAENQDTTFFSDDSGLENESSQEESSWSMDGNIEDVMGVRAGVDGDNVVIEYKTKHTDDYDYSYGNNPLTISYTGADGQPVTQTISFEWNGSGIHGDNWSNIDGAVLSKYSDQADTEILRMSIPASYFGSTDFTISGGKYSTAVNSSGIQSSAPNSSVYTGITMDGTFNDWNAVQKTELNEPEGQHNVESVAMQIEQDYVYIYIKDDGSNSATWAGPNSNGKYAITTDLGRTLVFQLTQDGAVVGADGAISNHQGSQWEIAIPTSSLPQNNGTLSFGLYLTEPTITGSGDFGKTSSAVGIDYDGLYGDWNDVKHTVIQYATAGTNENVPDSEAAMYFDQNNGNIYGHSETRMQRHIDQEGSEYTSGVSIIVNDDWSRALQMRLASVDSAGNINWNPDRSNLENGNHEYYIFGTDCWGTSQNISNLVSADICYGKATITITEGRHDMEWYVDSRTLAARYGISENDVKTVSSQYIQLGNELVTSAGASSGPWGGAVMCVLSALVPFVIKKKFTF